MTIFAFPMEQIGQLLRSLSLYSAWGNTVAIALYIILCSIPFLIYGYLKRKHVCMREDGFLIIIGIYSFIMMYFMVNPNLFPCVIPNGTQIMFGSVFYSMLCTYLMIRLLTIWKNADMAGLHREIQRYLSVLFVLFIVIIVFACGGDVIEKMNTVREGNTGLSPFNLTYLFLILQGVVRAVPYVFNMMITRYAKKAVTLLAADDVFEEAMCAVTHLSKVCINSLKISMLSTLTFNVLQLFFQHKLYKTEFSVEIPIFSLVFILAVLLFARYVQEYQKLKQENDLFI